MRKVFAVIVLLSLISVQLILFGGVGIDEGPAIGEPTRGDSYINETTSTIAIGNDHIEFVLNKDVKYGISKIIDKRTGLDLRGNKVPPPIMLMIMYWTGNATDVVIQWDAEDVNTNQICARDHVLLIINYYRFRGHALNATVYITLYDDDMFANFTLRVQCGESFTLKSIFFPMIWGLGQIGTSAEDDRVFYPVGDGIIVNDPLKYPDQLHMTEMYPSTASMQMMCHYDPDEAGLYLTTDDDRGFPKKPSIDWMEWSGIKHLAMFYEFPMAAMRGSGYRMEFDCRIGVFQGDWYDAADIYKEWAYQTDFISGGKVFEEKDTPEWWSRTSVVSSSNRDADWIHNTLSEIENMTREFNELTGVNTTHLIFAWAKNGAWCGPYYFPPAAGEQNFTGSMENISDMGGHPFLYISGSVWRITRGDIGYEDYETFNDIGKKWACIDENGDPVIDEGYLILNWTSARMCPMTSFWQNMVITNVLKCIYLGVDVVQIDEFPIGSVYPCHNTSHGHPPGYSEDITAAYRSIVNETRYRGRTINSDLILSMEEPCEFYIPWMDTYVSRDNAPEFLLYPFAVEQFGNDVEFVPFFSYVYHEYITAFSEPIPMNYNYPELFINQMRRSLARALVTGEIISGSADDKENLRPEVIEFYNTTVRASTGFCNDYLIKGKMLRPPRIDVPNTTVDWFFYSNQTIGRQIEERSVLHSSWKADDGYIGHVFVNWIDSGVDFDVELARYDLDDGNYSIVVTRNGEKELLLKRTELPVTIHLETDPGEVILVEITQLPDLVVWSTHVPHPPEILLTNDTYVYRYIVTNEGIKESGPFEVSLYLDDVLLGSGELESVSPGNLADLTHVLSTKDLLGEYNISFIVDPENEIFELNESNNIAWRIVKVIERPRANLTVKVLDHDSGLPIENAVVQLHNTTWPEDMVKYSNDSGAVDFNSMIAGEYTLNVSMTGYDGSSINVTLREGENKAVDIVLNRTVLKYSINGVVVDLHNNSVPISGANVTLFYRDNQTVASYLITGDDGEFNFTGLLEGNYSIRAMAENYYGHTIHLNISGEELNFNVILELKTPIDPDQLVFGGRITDSQTGEPIVGVLVKVNPGNYSFITDLDGNFSGSALPDGQYVINISRDGYHTQLEPLRIMYLTDVWINLTMERIEEPEKIPAIIRGTVKDEFGETIPYASVIYNGTQFVVTDLNGTFTIDGLDPGIYHLNVSADGHLYNDTVSVTVDYGDKKFVEIIILKEEEDPEDTDEFYGRNLIIITVIITLLVLLVILFFMRRSATAEYEE